MMRALKKAVVQGIKRKRQKSFTIKWVFKATFRKVIPMLSEEKP